VRFYEFGKGLGPSFLRNRGIELASTEFVFPIDDDSAFSSPHVVGQTLKEFGNPRVAAVAIPFVNPRFDWTPRQLAPDAKRLWVIHAFVGAAHAVRRSPFLKIGGYREHFFYMGEEGDLCIRLLADGFVVRVGTGDPIYHMESAQRDLALADFCGRRNDVLFAWHNVPMPWLAFHLVGTTVNGLRSGVQSGHCFRMLRGLFAGYREILRRQQEREPVRPVTYLLHRRLKKRGPERLEKIENDIPPLGTN
jgi:GT2 family glycosyltransferase